MREEQVFPWRLVLTRGKDEVVLALFYYRSDADQFLRMVRAIYVGTLTIEVNL